ncbi:MAG: caspase family protein [Treponema sp.]|jgi:hypothetical protein|nr:caspase family protein [Treponema sp.]
MAAPGKPVADAQEIRDILREQYYIDEFIELYDASATRANIARAFTDLQGRLNINDSLFIYYAGHGYLDPASQQGFWIPVNAGLDEYEQDNWLANSLIRGYISRLKTIHVFMVSDACFSGDILNTDRARPASIDNAYYRRLFAGEPSGTHLWFQRNRARRIRVFASLENVPSQEHRAFA